MVGHQRRSPAPTDRDGREAGTGLIGTSAAVAAFLLFLLFAVQLSVNLYATSTVTAAGYDAARGVASHRVDHGDPASVAAAQRMAETRFQTLLGRSARNARLDWTVDGTTVALRVRVDAPTVLPRRLGAKVGLDEVDRTFVVRVEQLR